MTSRKIEAGRAFVRMGTEGSVEGGLSKARKSLLAVGAAISGVAASAGALATKFATFGDNIQKMGLRTGLSAEALSELKFAAEQSGTTIESLGQALFRSTRRISNAAMGTGPAVRALKELGASAEELSQMSAEQRFMALVRMLGEVGDAGKRAQLGFEIFGDNIRQIMPLINEGTEGIGELRKRADELGLVISQEQADTAAELTDKINELKRAFEGFLLAAGSDLADPLVEVLDKLVFVLKQLKQFRDVGGTFFGVPIGGGALDPLADARAELARRQRAAEEEEIIVEPEVIIEEGLQGGKGPLRGVAETLIGDALRNAFGGPGTRTLMRGILPEGVIVSREGSASRRERGASTIGIRDTEATRGVSGRIVDAAAAAEERIMELGAAFKETQRAAASTAGTFSAAGARRLGRAGEVDQLQLKTLERIEDAIEGGNRLLEGLKGIVWR